MTSFDRLYLNLLGRVMEDGFEVEVGEWQSQDVRDKPHMVSREIQYHTLKLQIPERIDELQQLISPNLPWAEDHFQERVSGKPLNPPPSEAWWPFAVKGNAEHKEGDRFSHTYPERMWCKKAGDGVYWQDGEAYINELHFGRMKHRNHGVRYDYGDLEDVIKQLQNNLLTRQAYLPIWFPEDTGAVHGQRVPCTLGYHFLCRRGSMDIVYYIRSCDLLRHFKDDVYMACRLLQWVVDMLNLRHRHVEVGRLVMHISSLHIFRGDYPMVEQLMGQKFRQEYEHEWVGDYGSPI